MERGGFKRKERHDRRSVGRAGTLLRDQATAWKLPEELTETAAPAQRADDKRVPPRKGLPRPPNPNPLRPERRPPLRIRNRRERHAPDKNGLVHTPQRCTALNSRRPVGCWARPRLGT
jgi:hypothetical protein